MSSRLIATLTGTLIDTSMSSPRYTERTSSDAITAAGGPSISLRPKSIAIIRSTTRSRAWTMCSIHTTATPAARMSRIVVDQLEHLGLGQAARDLVEEQQPRLGRQRSCQFEALAFEQRQRAGGDVGAVEHARPARAPRPRSLRRRSRSTTAAPVPIRTSSRRARSRTRSGPRTDAGSATCVRCPGGSGRVPGGRVMSTPSRRPCRSRHGGRRRSG